MASSRPLSSLPSSVRKSATTTSVSSRGQLPPRAPNSSQTRATPHHYNNGVYTPRQLGLTRYSPGRAARLQQHVVLPTIADNEEDPPESPVEESQELVLTPPAAAATVRRCDNFDSQISGITMDHALQGAEDITNHANEEEDDIHFGRDGGFDEEEEEDGEEETALLNNYSAPTYSLNERLRHFMGCHITSKNRIAAEYVLMFQAYSYNKSLGPAKRADQNVRMVEQYKELIAMIPHGRGIY